MTLAQLVVAVALQIHRGTPPPEVVQAIASAASTPEEAAVATIYAALESDYRPGAVGDGGKSCSILQMPCRIVRGMPLEQQVRLWLRWVRDAGLASVDSSPSRAARRLALSKALLSRVQNP